MTHDCRINYLEASEDKEGYLYIEWTKAFGTNTGKFPVEYCPICGMKAKKSRIERLSMFNREDVDQVQVMHQLIIESFLKSCDLLVKEDLDDHEFQFCLDTINNTVVYVTQKRKKKNESQSR